MISCSGSVAAVMSAMAALRFTGRDARTGDHRAAIEPLTSSASSTGLPHGSTLLNVA